MQSILVYIIDTDLLFIDKIKESLANEQDIMIVGHSVSVNLAMEKLRTTTNVCCIVNDSLFLKSLLSAGQTVAGVIVASYNGDREEECSNAAKRTIDALSEGAFDYFSKPDSRQSNPLGYLQRVVPPKIRCLSIRQYSRLAKKNQLTTTSSCKSFINKVKISEPVQPILKKMAPDLTSKLRFEVCVIGVSTGGPEALLTMLPLFPFNFPIPLVIVIHMPKGMTKPLAELLSKKSALSVKESVDNEVLNPGTVYIAPGGLHVIFERSTRNKLLLRTIDSPPENGVKPAVDVLLRSSVQVVREKMISVILTGMGVDGLSGLKAYHEFKIPIIAQDEATSVVWGMPGNVVRAGLATSVNPLTEIPSVIHSYLAGTT